MRASISHFIKNTSLRLVRSSTPRLDSELLLTFVLKQSRAWVHAHSDAELSADQLDQLRDLVERRVEGEPIAYLLGHKEFMGYDFTVNRNVLVPRPDTELMVERAIEIVDESKSTEAVIADLGTGSGCIVLSIAKKLQESEKKLCFLAVDKSLRAIDVASHNAQQLKVKAHFVCADWATSLKSSSIDLVVCNPPYVVPRSVDNGDSIRFEPPEALYGGDTGLEEFRKILPQLERILRPNGTALLECGWDQAQSLVSLSNELFGLDVIAIHQDLEERERMVEIRRAN